MNARCFLLLFSLGLVSVATGQAKKLGTQDMPPPNTGRVTSRETRENSRQPEKTLVPPISIPVVDGVVSLSVLSTNKSYWPAVVRLTNPIEFSILRNGQKVGSTTAPIGSELQLVSVEDKSISVIFGTMTNQIVASVTDLTDRVVNIERAKKEAYEAQLKRQQDAEIKAQRAKARELWLRERPLFRATVSQVVRDGLLVQLPSGKTVLLTKHPAQKRATDGVEIEFRAEMVGRYSYTTVLGAVRTIERWQYCELPEELQD